MEHWGTWITWSVPLYVVLTMRLTGRAGAAALWAYLWLIADFCAASTWGMYQGVLAYRRLDAADPEFLARYERVLREGLATTALMVVYPVVWYGWVRRTEGGRGGTRRTAQPPAASDA